MNAKGEATSSNFGFLAKRYPQLERIGALGERYFSDDPIVSLITVRQFGEVLAQLVAARSGLFTDANEPQADLLRRLRVDGNYPRNVLDLFHQLRIDGNAATHRREGDHATALACLKMARQLESRSSHGPFLGPDGAIFHEGLQLARRVNSRQRSTSVGFGAKRTLPEPRLQDADL
jgi:hypothetical protein